MKITKRQLRRIIKEEKRKLVKEQAGGIDYKIQQTLDSLGYKMSEEIDGSLSVQNRQWREDPAIVQAIIEMLDGMKAELGSY